MAAFLSLIVLGAPSYINIITRGSFESNAVSSSMSWIAVPLVLSVVVLSVRSMVLASVISVIGVLMLPLFTPGLQYSALPSVIGYVALLSVLILLVRRQRDLLEQDRQQEIRKLNKNLEYRNVQIRTAVEVSQRAITVLEHDKMLNQTVNLIQERFDYLYVGLFLLEDGSSEHATLRAESGRERGMQAARKSMAVAESSPIGWVISKSKPLVVNYRQVGADDSMEPMIPGAQSAIILPLIVRERAIGALVCQSDEDAAFSEEDVAVMEIISDQLAIAIDNARLFSRVQQHATELEDRVQERTAQLNAVNRELEDFAHIVSHDLKAPLRAIAQIAGWIEMDHGHEFGERASELFNLLKSRVHRMGDLIDGILRYSRVGRDKTKKTHIELNKTLAEIISSLAPPAHIQMKVKAGMPTIFADRTHVEQVFQNLISNAIKFMDKPEGIVEIESSQYEGGWLFRVADNGPGIDEKYHEKVFEIFETLSPRDELESTGVGLTITQKIVEGWGGKIWIESKVGQGATFCFTLPQGDEHEI